MVLQGVQSFLTRVYKDGRFEYEHVTPMEARSLVKIIELY